MLKPVTQALTSFREHLASKFATLPPGSDELKTLMDIYERMQSISLAEHIEEDLSKTYGTERNRLYNQFLRVAALRERIAARNAREKAAILRKLEQDKRDTERKEREADRKAREAERQERESQSRATDPALV